MILTIIESILPLILYSLAGGLFARICKLEKKHSDAVMLLVFNLLMPANLFLTAYTASVDMRELLPVVILACTLTILCCVLSSIVSSRFAKETATSAAFASILWKGNYTMLGLPIAAAFFSEEGYAIYALVAVVLSILSNLIVIPQMAYLMRQKTSGLGAALKSICKNPAALSAIAGLIARPLLPGLPNVVQGTLSGLASCSGVVSMLMIGISIGVNKPGRQNRLLVCSGFGKLVLMPLLFFVSGYFLGIRGHALNALVLSAALPPGITAGAFARAFHADDAFANEAVFSLTAVSAVTLFVFGVLMLQLPS